MQPGDKIQGLKYIYCLTSNRQYDPSAVVGPLFRDRPAPADRVRSPRGWLSLFRRGCPSAGPSSFRRGGHHTRAIYSADGRGRLRPAVLIPRTAPYSADGLVWRGHMRSPLRGRTPRSPPPRPSSRRGLRDHPPRPSVLVLPRPAAFLLLPRLAAHDPTAAAGGHLFHGRPRMIATGHPCSSAAADPLFHGRPRTIAAGLPCFAAAAGPIFRGRPRAIAAGRPHSAADGRIRFPRRGRPLVSQPARRGRPSTILPRLAVLIPPRLSPSRAVFIPPQAVSHPCDLRPVLPRVITAPITCKLTFGCQVSRPQLIRSRLRRRNICRETIDH